MTNQKGMWVIGYGSLIFKPPPHVSFKVTGYLTGFIRRFWQSSIDHRGTPEYPGRVVTLISLKDLQNNEKFHDDLHMYELKEDSNNIIIDVKKKIHELKEEDLKVYGVAYYIKPENFDEVKEYLDIREQNGYTDHKVPFHILNIEKNEVSDGLIDDIPNDKNGKYIESMIYIGTTENEAFIGPESLEDTAKVIRTSIGPSGKNSEYLINLTEAIKHFGIRDYYLEDLLQLL
ncbi:Glutathione-specific gamma-glutamylcyclotransferase [Candida tropicalis]